MFTELFKTNY